jgi:hypothetical protein
MDSVQISLYFSTPFILFVFLLCLAVSTVTVIDIYELGIIGFTNLGCLLNHDVYYYADQTMPHSMSLLSCFLLNHKSVIPFYSYNIHMFILLINQLVCP